MTRSSATIEVLCFDSIQILQTGSSSVTCVTSGATASVGDFMVNINWRKNPPVRYGDYDSCRRKIIYASGSTFEVSEAIAGQTRNNVIALYKYKDVTQYLKEGSLKMNLSSKGNSEASFTFELEPEPPQKFIHTGGWDDSFVYGFVLGFTLASGTWVNLSGMPVERAAHSSYNIAGNCYAGMGVDNSINRLSSWDMYDNINDAWINKTGVAVTRSECQEAAIEDYGYLCGGYDDPGNFYGTLEKYDPVADTWAALTSGDFNGMALGKGMNLCNTLFVDYYRNDTTFAPHALWYLPISDTWQSFIVNSGAPLRLLPSVTHILQGFKAGMVGGAADKYASPSYIIANHTMVNFIAGVYYENLPWPTYIMDPSSAAFDDFGIVAGGQEDVGVFLDTTNFWVYNTDEVWTAGGGFSLPAPISAGRGVSI